MRLASLEVSGFRGFTRHQSFNLGAETIVFIGSNGQGKSSLFDAILWGLTGRVQRFSGDQKLLSLFSETGTMEVEVVLEDGNEVLLIRRTFDGKAQRLKVQHGVESYEGASAESLICRTLSPGITDTTSLEGALVQGVYLQQDRLRDFIEAQDESSRFSALSSLIGAGRLNDLQVQLDNAKSAWTRATNQRLTEAEVLDKRVRALESQLLT
jgi:exonuclease SbcC